VFLRTREATTMPDGDPQRRPRPCPVDRSRWVTGSTARSTAPAPRWLVIVRTPPTKQIGEKLSLSPRTVSTHLYRIFPKPRVTSRAGLRDAITGSAQT
jgi:hypothetical protein